ncbi:MAG TPA: hypothetical protein VEV15_10225 [Flavisolibacter sp.]|nr:hypothetical protein [Flavisolibacter sp.]
MNSRDNIQNELNDMDSHLPSHTGQNPFAVPEGYFEGLAASVMSKIKGQHEPSASQEIAELSPLLAGIPRSTPYAVPLGYFQTTIEELPFLTGEDPKSAILSLVERVTPYEVPTGYFDDLPEQVLNKLAPKAKVIPIVRRRWMRLVAAAMITGIMGLSGYFYLTQKGRLDANKPIAAQLKNVSIRELDDFIKTADIASSSTETAQRKAADETEVQKMLISVSDRELDVFLSQVPTDDLLFN